MCVIICIFFLGCCARLNALPAWSRDGISSNAVILSIARYIPRIYIYIYRERERERERETLVTQPIIKFTICKLNMAQQTVHVRNVLYFLQRSFFFFANATCIRAPPHCRSALPRLTILDKMLIFILPSGILSYRGK